MLANIKTFELVGIGNWEYGMECASLGSYLIKQKQKTEKSRKYIKYIFDTHLSSWRCDVVSMSLSLSVHASTV